MVSPSAEYNTTRTLLSWTQANTSWSDNWFAPVQVMFNLSGLSPNTIYRVMNDSAIDYTYTTDASGVLTPFTINFTTSAKTIKVLLVVSYIPPTPTIDTVITGNFYKNITYTNGSGNVTNGYNITRNGTWYNGTATFLNTTTIAHGWINDTLYAWNSSGTGTLGSGVTNNTQIPNNAPALTVSNQTIDENQTVYIQLNSTDVDGDALTYSINRTDLFTDFDTAIGKGNWTTNFTTAGIYYIDAGVMDNYSSITNYTFIITVNNIPLNISSFLPATDPTTTQGTEQTFSIVLNRTANVTWLMNGTQVQYNSSITIANYSNSTAGVGIHNITVNINESVSPDTDSHIWNWSVAPQIPNITSWSNDNTYDNSLTLTVPRNTNVSFNATSNQTMTSWTWTGATQINGSSSNDSYAFKNFTIAGVKTVSVYGINTNGSTQTITWTITVTALGGFNLTVNVKNTLGLNLQNSRIDVNNSLAFTDTNGNAIFTNITEGDYDLLARAIGYGNSSGSISLSGSSATTNLTLREIDYATKEDAVSAGTMGLIGGIIGGMIVIGVLKRRKG